MRTLFAILLSLAVQAATFAHDHYTRLSFADVVHYEFSIAVNDSNNIIAGHSVISVRFTGSADTMFFDLKNTGPDGKGMRVGNVTFNKNKAEWFHKSDRLAIVLDNKAVKGEEGTFIIDYSGIPADGLIISDNKFGRRTFFADNWPDRARNWIPCVDHPYDKATVDFIVKTPGHYMVVGSGRLVENSYLPDGTRLTHWKEEVPLATKVMAIGIASFATELAGIVDNIPVWTWVFPENRREGFNDYAVGTKPLHFYISLLGPYSYEKLADVQSKTIFGGLENAGCIFYSENSVTGKDRAESLMAHEIAHQWFGNSVTEKDWHHIWLSEGFATYLTAVYMEKTYGKDMLDQTMTAARNRVLRFYLRSPQPVIDTTITNLMALLNPNSYQKGAWVLHMLRHKLGDESFWDGMRLFYKRYRNGNANTDDFQKVMEEVSRTDLNKFFHQWLYIAGQPELAISYKPSRKKGSTDISIEQKQDYLFTFNIDLLVKFNGSTGNLTVPVSDRITVITVKGNDIKEIIPDPGINLLFSNVSGD
jgi:aminopeptidase N